MIQDIQTLTQRLAAGYVPLSDTLRRALQIADALQHAHDEGHYHGALTPDAVLLNRDGVELVPAQPGAVDTVTPYTAPERLKGLGPDARTDIYALGALIYEMITGRRAFAAPDDQGLAHAIENSLPEPVGDIALDRLVLNCLAKDPACRRQRIQQVRMEIKIVAFSERLAQAAGTPRPEIASQGEVRGMESRLTARLDEYERTLAGLREVSLELPLMEARLASQLDSQQADTLDDLHTLMAELPRLEQHWASCLQQQHVEAMSRVEQLAAEVLQAESRLISRLEHQEKAFAGLPRAIFELPEMESRLAERLTRHDEALAALDKLAVEVTDAESRLDRQECAIAGVSTAVNDMPQWECRLRQHDEALAGLQRVAEEVPQVESRLGQHGAALSELRQVASQQSSAFLTASQTLVSLEERTKSLTAQLSAIRETAERAETTAGQASVALGKSTDAQISMAEQLHAIELTVKAQASTIESVRNAVARTDDFMEQVVEALESLQTMVLDRAGDHAAAGAA